MAKKGTTQASGLNMTARLDTATAIKNARDYIKVLNEIKAAAGISNSALGSSATPGATGMPGMAQAQLQLQRVSRATRQEIERLKIEEQQLINTNVRSGQATTDLTNRILANRLAQQELTAANRRARQEQTAAIGSYREAQQRLRQLGDQIRNVSGGFQSQSPLVQARIREYNRLNAQLTEFDRRLGIHGRNVGNYSSALSGVGNQLKSIIGGYIGFTAAIMAVGAVVRGNSELSDSYSDVQRTAGLTAKEVENLSEQLKKIDTRTSLKGLFDIAIIGGQLGIAKDQLAGFTKAVDQLSVSLKGELQGGPEEVAKRLGVLNNVFGIAKKEGGDVEKAFNRIGSTILGLGQSGLATGDFLSDFGERVGGVAAQAKLSLPVLLSYGAVLQENGVSAEVAGTAFKKLIGAIATKREKFLAVAQIADASLTLKEFTNIINTDTQKALQLFFNGLKKGGSNTTQFLDLMKSVGMDAARAGQAISALALHQEDLNEHIKQSSIDYDEASLSAEQFALKNNNLAGSIDKLGNRISNAFKSGPVASFFKAIVDGIDNMITGFGNIVTSRSWAEFWTRVTPFANTGNFDLANRLSDSLKKNKDTDWMLVDQGTRNPNLGADKLKELLTIADKAEQKARKDLIEFNNGLKQKKLVDTDGKFLKQYTDQVAKAASTTSYFADQYVKARAKIKPAKKDDPVDITGITDGKSGEKAQRAAESAASRAFSLQKKIDAINAEYSNKQLLREDAEIEAVRFKFQEITKEVERFNKNPRNTTKVDGSGLTKNMRDAIDDIMYKASNDRLKDQLGKQAKLYEDFEAYRLQFGTDAAKKRYGMELKSQEDFLAELEKRQGQLLSTDPTKMNENQKAELEIVKAQIDQVVEYRKQVQDRSFAEAYQAAKTHAQTLGEIDADYNRKRAALGANATQDQLGNLSRERDARIRSANEANAFAKSGYADLMMQYDELTRGEIRRRLEAMKESYRQQFRDGKINAEQLSGFINQINGDISRIDGNNSFKKITAAIKQYRDQVKLLGADSAGAKEAQEAMFQTISDGAADISSVIGELASSFQELGIGGEELQNTMKQVGGVVDGLGGIAKGLATGNPVDIVTGSIKLLTSAIDLFNFKDKKLAKQIKGYQAQLDSLGKAYKQLERDVQNAVGESIYSDQAAQIENLQRQQQELIKMRNAENDKKKTDANKVKEFQDQIDAIPGQIDDINKAISQNLIQGTFRDLSNSLADAFAEAFKSGEDGIAKMDEVFNQFIGNAIKNSLKLKILDPVVKKFTDELTDFAKTNNNSIVGFDFDKWKEQLKQAGELFNAGLKGSEEFFKDINTPTAPDKKTGISGTIVGEALKEDTANRMLGIDQGIYDLTKQNGLTMGQMLQIGQQKLAVLQRIELNTKRGADNTDGHTDILNKIAENTAKPSPSSSDPLGQSLRDAGLVI